jgi:endonuclease/exonuclease/phosphatase family metal-dependent hydrolase
MRISFFPLKETPELSIRRWVTRLIASLVLLALLGGGAAAQTAGYGRALKVMTRNLYQGTDFTEVMASTDYADFVHNVTVTLNNVQATRPELRMQAIAREVAAETPHILAVQEATVWMTSPTMDPAGLTDKYNLLAMLATDLAMSGTPYVPVVINKQFEFAAPDEAGGLVYVAVLNSILVRADALTSGELVLTGQQEGVFSPEHTLQVPLLGGMLPIVRGWASIDASFQGRAFRFVTAHPEAFHWYYDMLQIGELLTAGPANTAAPVILAADFNTNAAGVPGSEKSLGYGELLQAGFADAWPASYPAKSGFTCCQNNDLLNPQSLFDERIDLIMTKGFSTAETKVIGGNVPNRVDGLWPSDHAGIVTKLRFQ